MDRLLENDQRDIRYINLSETLLFYFHILFSVLSPSSIAVHTRAKLVTTMENARMDILRRMFELKV